MNNRNYLLRLHTLLISIMDMLIHNAYAPQNAHVEILTPKVMVLAGGFFGSV